MFHYTLFAQEPARYDLIFHEVYADPTPSRGLPNGEFIEVVNRSAKDINLKNWMISNGTTMGKINANFLLKPDSLVLLVSSGSLASFSSYSGALALSPFPTLNNDGDTLELMSANGKTIDAIAWDKSWYGNDVKEDGGWSIELKDAKNPCAGKQNWGASLAPQGGTPGRKNSIATTIRDNTYPKLLYAYMPNSLTLFAMFDEAIEPILSLGDIRIENGPVASSVSLLPPLFRLLHLQLSAPLKKDEVYTVQVGAISDCSGNKSPPQSTRVGVFSEPRPGDIVVNEILFDPPPGGSDYLELFNTSTKTVDVRSLMIANRNSLGKISSIREIAPHSFPFFPGDYIVLSADTGWMMKTYQPGQIKSLVTDLPSYPDTEGDVVLLEQYGSVLEEFRYFDKWHFQLISRPEGVALERIMQNRPAQNRENWHSASTTSGYGTPGKVNSQQIPTKKETNPWSFSNKIISPDGDGMDDLLIISYNFPEPGYMVNLTAFSASGKPVKKIAQNVLCGTTGFFKWEGIGDRGERLPRGHYILYAELFSLDGTLSRTKETIGIW